MSTNDDKKRGQSLGSVAKSVIASMIGIQSSDKHEEDFKKGKVSTYIVMGIVATTLFILVIVGLVNMVMSLAQP